MKIRKISAIVLGTFLLGCGPSSHTKKASNEKPSEVNQSAVTTINDSASSQQRDTLKNGIDFKATGNEPFWSLEINFDKSMHFNTLNGIDIITPVPEGVKAMDANVTRYRAQTEQGELIVQIAKQECTNDMSGKKSDYSVTVNYKRNNDKDYQNYKGCGAYLSDYRLNDIWVLESVNNKPIDKEKFKNKIPSLEFNLAEKRVSGNGGCNIFSGQIELLGKKIKFGNLASTMMACEDMKFETVYLKGLTNHTLPYHITPRQLHLQFNSDSVFVYKKVD